LVGDLPIGIIRKYFLRKSEVCGEEKSKDKEFVHVNFIYYF